MAQIYTLNTGRHLVIAIHLVLIGVVGCAPKEKGQKSWELDDIASFYYPQIEDFVLKNIEALKGFAVFGQEESLAEMFDITSKFGKIFEDQRVLEAYIVFEENRKQRIRLSRRSVLKMIEGAQARSERLLMSHIDYPFSEGKTPIAIERITGGKNVDLRGFHYRKSFTADSGKVIMGVMLVSR